MEQDRMLFRERLVKEISHYVQDENILNAFRKVPRHKFIGNFFDRSYVDNKQIWTLVSPTDPRWMSEIYANRPLTTSLDENNRPNVSSSQPDIMAKMLDSVKLRPGNRVLEIGTGTGYNAALLATIVGTENVVSIDINDSLLEVARERIECTVGSNVTVLHTDGRNLPDFLGGFDAIIATGSHDRVESSWIRALVEGGRILFNWNKSLTTVFLEAQKSGSGLIGNVAPYGGEFMQLHDGTGVNYPMQPYKALPVIASLDFSSQLFDLDFRFFLQIHMPSLTYHRYRTSSGTKSYSVKDRNNRVVNFSPTQIRGDVSLWEEISLLYTRYEELHKPRKEDFSLRVTHDGTITFIYEGYEVLSLIL
jgi:protein-L-isoaspartate(D-aspartate) O-methyltransferase